MCLSSRGLAWHQALTSKISSTKKGIFLNGAPVPQILVCNRQMLKLQIEFESQLNENYP